MRGAVVQLSGGVDSAAAATVAQAQYGLLVAHFVDYGQPYAAQEEQASRYVHRALQLDAWVKTTVNLPQTAPVGSVKEYVPIRNAVLGMLSASLAMAHGLRTVVVGSKTVQHRPGDPYSFRDCTVAFFAALAAAVQEGSEDRVGIAFEMPVSGWTKQAALTATVNAGLQPSRLWWCYTPGLVPCGHCEHCVSVAHAQA